MQIGYNNDVEYRKKTFHIQTEDRGEASASIETQIFHSGAILDTSIITYNKVLASTDDIDERIERIRALMQGNHKKLYKRLFAGDYDEMVGLEPIVDPNAVVADDFVPSQEAVPAAALEIERGNITALDDGMDGQAFSLADLQAQLNADAAAAEADDSPPTMAIAAPDIATTQETPAIKPNGLRLPTYPKTGAVAWRGCEPMSGDADITQLVEEFAR